MVVIKQLIQGVLSGLGYELRRIQSDEDRLAFYEAQPWVGVLKQCAGVDFSPERQLRFARKILPLYQHEFSQFSYHPASSDDAFCLDNGWYESIDAEVLYTHIRHYSPSRVIEVGSGYSTQIIHRALSMNDAACEVISIDPEPRADIRGIVDRHIRARVEELPVTFFQTLRSNDMLVIDSSHRVEPGGDVVYLICDILPVLNEGVFVHFHDICLPREYSAFELQHLYTEQYLLQAFLCSNRLYDITFSGHYMWEYHRDELIARIPSATPDRRSGVVWMRRTGHDACSL